MYVEAVAGKGAYDNSPKMQTTAGAKSTKAAQELPTDQKTESTDGDFRKKILNKDDAEMTEPKTDESVKDEKSSQEQEKLKKVMEEMAATLPHSEPKFGIHEKTNRITIKLVDRTTQEVIKEIPPEKNLDLLAKRMELAGVLVDEKL